MSPQAAQLRRYGELYAQSTEGPDEGDSYYIGACGAVTGVTCSASPDTFPAAIQSWGGSPPWSGTPPPCASLGTASPRTCSAAGEGMRCTYAQGLEGRSLTVNYVCNRNVAFPHVRAHQMTPHVYSVNITGPHVCGVTPPLSTGSIALIIVSVVLVLYVGIGVAVNVRIRGRKWTFAEAFPQWEYWCQLPGLVRDGCAFSWEMTLKHYYSLRGTAPPLDPSLSRRLKDDEGGARSDAT